MRSGSPDFVDRLVAFTFAGMAMDALQEGNSGLMTAINEGRYAMVTIPDPKPSSHGPSEPSGFLSSLLGGYWHAPSSTY